MESDENCGLSCTCSAAVGSADNWERQRKGEMKGGREGERKGGRERKGGGRGREKRREGGRKGEGERDTHITLALALALALGTTVGQLAAGASSLRLPRPRDLRTTSPSMHVTVARPLRQRTPTARSPIHNTPCSTQVNCTAHAALPHARTHARSACIYHTQTHKHKQTHTQSQAHTQLTREPAPLTPAWP